MIRFITILCWVSLAVAQNSELDNAFVLNENYNISHLKCENIEGDLKGCYECYLCDDEKILEKKRLGKTISNLKLVNGDCKSTKVCCISLRDLSFRGADPICGASNPTGFPYSVRPRLRAVLPGEYPWRAWVYSKTDDSQPLCAATYIHDTARLLLVPGNCVRDERPDSLFVRFSKHTQEKATVKKIVFHDQFDSDTQANDIALLSLESYTNIPEWVKPACMPEIAQLYGSMCVGVSDNDNAINFGILNQSKCKEIKSQFAPSLMCAIAPPRDYKHEYGGGLFCLTNNKKRSTYVVYGIALYRHGDEVSVYTDIYKMRQWITNSITNIL